MEHRSASEPGVLWAKSARRSREFAALLQCGEWGATTSGAKRIPPLVLGTKVLKRNRAASGALLAEGGGPEGVMDPVQPRETSGKIVIRHRGQGDAFKDRLPHPGSNMRNDRKGCGAPDTREAEEVEGGGGIPNTHGGRTHIDTLGGGRDTCTSNGMECCWVEEREDKSTKPPGGKTLTRGSRGGRA